MRHQTINDFRNDLHAIALRAQQGRTTFADAERLRSIAEGLGDAWIEVKGNAIRRDHESGVFLKNVLIVE